VSKRAESRTGNLVLAVLLMVSIGASAETLTGTVVGVADGDTITVLDAHHEQHKIRVAGIDAPEKAQPFGQRSKESMSAMVFGKEVDVLWHKHDRYQRIVGKVMVQPSGCRRSPCPKTLDAGLAQLTLGLAWWYENYAKEQSPEDAGRYEFAEHEARGKRAGLWADGHALPPWEWRKGER
jgi:endonuclease YncB( thermonuclease family)